jgi:LmbE family N-acetylglucosaminyl deacetylase
MMTTLVDPGQLGTVLGVWAHPDDEAMLSGGLMAIARAGGQRVAVVTATRGELGTTEPDVWPPARLGRLRAAELRRALAAVDVTEQRFLGYVDGTLPQVPWPVGVTRIAQTISEVRPDTIVTFGPDGLTGHDDHRTVSAWATAARAMAAPDAQLLYATTTASFEDQWGDVNEQFGVYFAREAPPRTPDDEVALALRLTGEMLDRKVEALRAHASQTAGMVEALGADAFRAWWSTETFLDAPPAASGCPLAA